MDQDQGVVETAAPAPAAPAVQESQQDTPQTEGSDKPEGEGDKPAEKPAKTPEQREIERLRRGFSRKVERLGRLEAELEHYRRLTQQPVGMDNRQQADDSEKLTLSRAEVQRLIEEEALKKAPEVATKLQRDEQFKSAAQSLRQSLGEQFEELTGELAEVFAPARQLDVLQAENPAALIRYLTDTDHADEAEAIAGMTHFQAGRAIARLEEKLKAAAVTKPQASKAPAPLEPVKGAGPVTKSLADMSFEEFVKARNKQLGRR